MINKMETVVVKEDEINKFLPVISKKLDWLSKEELIKRFVSVEFNRFIDYYRNAPDLNVEERHEIGGSEGRRGSGEFTRLFINLGKIDGIGPTQLIGLVNDTLQLRDVRIGKIEMLNTFSFFEIDSNYLEQLIKAFQTVKYQSRKVSIEVANKKTDRGGGEGRRRERPRDSDGDRGRDRSFGGPKKEFKKDSKPSFARDKDKGKPKKKRW